MRESGHLLAIISRGVEGDGLNSRGKSKRVKKRVRYRSGVVRKEEESAVQMKPVAKFAAALVKALWVIGLVLAFTLTISGRVYSGDSPGGQIQHGQRGSLIQKISPSIPAPGALEASTSHDLRESADFTMELDGDRSLGIATEVEQGGAGLVHYTIRLHLDSNREQLIDVMAPPGGLDPEVRDMTGDNVRNDLLLTPSLFCWPPTVLVNDGHDHFALAISGTIPDSVSSREVLTSGAETTRDAAGLISSGFKVVQSRPGREILVPQLRGSPLLSVDGTLITSPLQKSNTGRAPPIFAISI
jgi:hypothetical protein